MKILLTTALLLASVIGALAQETPPDTGDGRFSAARMAHQKQAAQAQAQQAQQPASVQDQLTSIYSTLNVNLAHQLDAANAEIAGLKAKLDAANSPPVNDITKEK